MDYHTKMTRATSAARAFSHEYKLRQQLVLTTTLLTAFLTLNLVYSRLLYPLVIDALEVKHLHSCLQEAYMLLPIRLAITS